MKSLKLLLTVLLATAALATSVTSSAAYKPNMLIMGEDSDKDTVPRGNRVFNRVLDSLSSEMQYAGYPNYDETAVTLDISAQDRKRRTDQELIDVARSIQRPPIDVVFIFQIYPRVNVKDHATKMAVRVSGRLLDVRTGKRIDNFELTTPVWSVAPDCGSSRECVLESIGDHSKTIASDVSAALAIILDSIVTGGGEEGQPGESQLDTAYNIIFEGFEPDEVMLFEDYLANVFSGFIDYRVSERTMRRIVIWYETTSRASKLTRNIHRMLDEEHLQAVVQQAGNSITVKKIRARNVNKPAKGLW